jgi:hypothetical protein
VDDATEIDVTLPDTNDTKELPLSASLTGKKFVFRIDAVYAGTKFKDTCITELSFLPIQVVETSD